MCVPSGGDRSRVWEHGSDAAKTVLKEGFKDRSKLGVLLTRFGAPAGEDPLLGPNPDGDGNGKESTQRLFLGAATQEMVDGLELGHYAYLAGGRPEQWDEYRVPGN